MTYQKYFIGSKIFFLILTFLFYPESNDEFLAVINMLCSDTYQGLFICGHIIQKPLIFHCSNISYIVREVCVNNCFRLWGYFQRNHILMSMLTIALLSICFPTIIFIPFYTILVIKVKSQFQFSLSFKLNCSSSLYPNVYLLGACLAHILGIPTSIYYIKLEILD